MASQIVPRLKMDSLATDSAIDDFYKIDRRGANRFLGESLLAMLADKSDECKGRGDGKHVYMDDSMAERRMAEENLQNVQSARAILSARFSSVSANGSGDGENDSGKLPPKSPRTNSAELRLDADKILNLLLVRSKLILRVSLL
ncbi:hypothetical protein niasHS_010729 [Heterodera schachtii]|uniref:Uncharacterized protein n=1 Tax=Heterodera schachtii TaxID=97005 RepID=A0ABD2ISF7_HETSC